MSYTPTHDKEMREEFRTWYGRTRDEKEIVDWWLPQVASEVEKAVEELLEELDREVEGMKIDMNDGQNQVTAMLNDMQYEVIGYNKALSDLQTLLRNKQK